MPIPRLWHRVKTCALDVMEMYSQVIDKFIHILTKKISLTSIFILAEEIVEKGHSYHKKCFTCINCNRPQLDKLQVYVGFDHQIYCKTCYPKIWHTPLPLESRSKIKAEPGDDSGCPRCHGKVFEGSNS